MDSGLKTARFLSVVVPVYNSELILPALIQRLEPALAALAEKYEVVLVNDGSRDHSWKVVQELSRAFPWVRGINLMRNYGQHNALLCGIRAARFDTLVTMDDDLQHPPEEIHKLLAKLDEGFEVVYGFPERERHGLLRNIASVLTKLALQNPWAPRPPVMCRLSARFERKRGTLLQIITARLSPLTWCCHGQRPSLWPFKFGTIPVRRVFQTILSACRSRRQRRRCVVLKKYPPRLPRRR